MWKLLRNCYQNVNPVGLQMGIKNINEDGILMELSSENYYEKYETEVITNENLKKIYCKESLEKRPKIITYGVNQELSDEEIGGCIEAQNEVPEESEVKVGF